jgi:hypothetical protein
MTNIFSHPLLFISLISIYSTIFSAYAIIDTTIVGLLLALIAIFFNINNIKLKLIEWIFLFFLFAYNIILLLISNSTDVILINVRFWYGLFLYVILFRVYSNHKILSIKFFRILCFCVLLEFVLVNTVIDVGTIHGDGNHGAGGMLGFLRPYGFTGDPSTTSTILITFLFLLERYKGAIPPLFDRVLLLFTVIISMSSTGILIYCLYLFLSIKINLSHIRRNLTFFSVILFGIFYSQIDQLQYFSPDYLYFVLEAKLRMILSSLDNLIIGNQLFSFKPNTSSDFGWYNMIRDVGILGLCIYFLGFFIFYGGDRKYLPVLFLMFTATFHYPAVFLPPGQVFLALIISLSTRKIYLKLEHHKK